MLTASNKPAFICIQGKAGRDQAVRVFAAENPDGPKILSWAPGVMETGMTNRAVEMAPTEEKKKMFEEIFKSGRNILFMLLMFNKRLETCL